MSNFEKFSFNENSKISNIINLLNDYLDEKRKTDESNLYLNILKNEIKALDYKTQKILQKYIYKKSKEVKNRDDKLQLLELYASIENNSIPETNEYNNLDFDVIDGTINGKYKIRQSEIINLGNGEYLIKIEAIKRQNKFINYKKKAEIKIKYNPRNGVIRYNDGYGRYKIANIDHKTEIKFNINHNNLGLYENINGTIYKKGTIVPINLKVKGQKIKLFLKF